MAAEKNSVRLLEWFAARDRGFSALRRACRTAIVMPIMFAIGQNVIGSADVAVFAAFGAFSMLLLVDFGGPMRARLEAMAALIVTGAVFITLGTIASGNPWIAALAMLIVGFAVLFAGVISSVLAGASFSLLLSFILPVCFIGPTSSVPDRLLGWTMSGIVALVAIRVLWPAPEHDPLRGNLRETCQALADRLTTESAFLRGGEGAPTEVERSEAVNRANAAAEALHTRFLATPYRPTGLSTSARLLLRLVDELGWLRAVLQADHMRSTGQVRTAVCNLKLAAGETLARSAAMLAPGESSREGLSDALGRLHEALEQLERDVTVDLPQSRFADTGIVTALEPSFRAREVGFATSLIGHNVKRINVAEHRGWWDRLLGHQPDGVVTPWLAARQRAATHLERHSVWLHNSIRGAIALSVAVFVANETGLQHSFWVVLGTLSVLRSNALNTGQFAVRGILGTVAGFVIGAAILKLIGTSVVLLWVLLPVAILCAGLAPAVISFAAGQAAFTITLVILFNIIQPAGWSVGLVRLEDVSLGCAVSLVVGLLFWPRGAAAALRKTLAIAYRDSAEYLERAVEFGLARHNLGEPIPPARSGDWLQAAAAYRRLDDALRTYLSERGAKPVPFAAITGLVSGVTALRIAGTALLELWRYDDGQSNEDSANAQAEVRAAGERIRQWYDELGAGIAGGAEIPPALEPDAAANTRLVEALQRDLAAGSGNHNPTVVRMIWTADHLDAMRRLGASLVDPARATVKDR